MTLRAEEQERILREGEARQEGWARWSKPSRYIVFLVIVVGLVSGVWFLIEEHNEDIHPKNLPTVRSEAEPYKVKVDEQDIPSVRHQDKLVYNRLQRGPDSPQIEHLLPEPEAPVAVAVVKDIKHEGEPEDVQAVTYETLYQAEEGPQEAVALQSETPQEPSIDPIAALIEGGVEKPKGPFVQLGTLESKAQATQEWKRLSARHKDLLAQWTPLIEDVDLGEKGIQYRLRVGPYASVEQAEVACKSLKAGRVGCLVIR